MPRWDRCSAQESIFLMPLPTPTFRPAQASPGHALRVQTHPFKFARNIGQAYVQVPAGNKEETIRFHSIYSCGAVLLTTGRMIFSKALLSICSPTVSEAKHRKDNIDFPERSAARRNLLREERPRRSLALGQEVISLSDCKVDLCSAQGERGAGTHCPGGAKHRWSRSPETNTLYKQRWKRTRSRAVILSCFLLEIW